MYILSIYSHLPQNHSLIIEAPILHLPLPPAAGFLCTLEKGRSIFITMPIARSMAFLWLDKSSTPNAFVGRSSAVILTSRGVSQNP